MAGQTPMRRSTTDQSEGDLPASLDAFQTGRLTRTIEVPYYERQRRILPFQATWLGSLFQKKHGVRIYDIDLQEDWVLIENFSNSPVSMGAYTLCDEERENKLEFPVDLVLQPGRYLKVICAPGRTKNLDVFEEEDGRTSLFLWKTPRGAPRSEHVLREDGDCMYLCDLSNEVVSAFSKTDDGAFKEYGALNQAFEQKLWRGLGLMFVFARIALLGTAGYCAIHTNLSSESPSAHPFKVVGCMVGAVVLDLLQREALLYAHLHDFFGEALAIFADRLHAMVIYGTLALFHGDYCALFLLFLTLDLASCWFQLFASDCGELEMKAVAGAIAQRAPSLLTLIGLASEAFLLLLYMDHGHVQFRLYQGIQPAAAAIGWSFFQSPVLTLPVIKDVLLMAFLTKQIIVLSQLWFCIGSLMNTTFPCVGDDAKTYLQHALESRQRPNLELLRNSGSLQMQPSEEN